MNYYDNELKLNDFHRAFKRIKNDAGQDWNDWKWQVRKSYTSLKQMTDLFGALDGDSNHQNVEDTFFTRVNPYYLSLAKDWSYNDPVILQSLPHINEVQNINEVSFDPLAEEEYSPVPGIVHRYPDRCLAIMTGFCATLCRHCMRKRNWLEPEAVAGKSQLKEMADYIRKTPRIREVLVTGGDPLLIKTETLDWFLGELRTIKHVEVIRIGTRVPVVIPQRLTKDFCEMLDSHGPIWIATHFNHANELSDEAGEALERLVRHGMPIVNQTVLMKGVNDDVEVIRSLCTKLVKNRVKPLYLFHGDPVKGTTHFRTGIEQGLKVMEGLRGHTSSLCIPTFAIDLPDGGGKVPLLPNYMVDETSEGTVFKSYDGRLINYVDKG